MQQPIKRCHWVTDDPLYIAYHDNEWGVPIVDSQKLFEFLILEGMQAGLSWITILKKRDNYRRCFADFNAEKIANFSEKEITLLLSEPGIIRNKLKIHAIVTNAKAYLSITDFSNFLWQFVEHQPQQNHYTNPTDIPVETDISRAMSKSLKQLGFKFVGPTICYAFMQAVGMVNDHLTTCYRHQQLNP